MPTPGTEAQTEIREPGEAGARDQRTGLGAAAKQVSEHASSLVRLELELATLELKRKVGALAAGIVLGLGALVFLLFALGFGLSTIVAGLDTFLARWLALLIVTVGLFVVTGVLGMAAIRALRRGTPPVPEDAIREAKLTTTALKRNGR